METNYENIEKYILGELNAEELAAFENRMQTDAAFKSEVELYISVNKSLENKYKNLEKEDALKSTLDKMGTKYFEQQKAETTSKTRSFKMSFIRVASLAAVLIIGFFLLKPQTNLYNEYAIHENLEVQVKGSNEEILLEASELFNQKKYEAATPLLESYLREKPEDQEIQMALGISLLESDKIEDAKIIFSHIYVSESVFKNKAAWYMALTNLKAGDITQTREFLKEIDSDSFYGKKADKLLKKLKGRK